MQDGQRILLTTPSVLVGFRVEVYRAEGTTQWYTAVIVGYNESTKVRSCKRYYSQPSYNTGLIRPVFYRKSIKQKFEVINRIIRGLILHQCL